MTIELHVGAGQPYATRNAGIVAIAAMYGGAGWPAEPVDLVVHGTVDEGTTLNVTGFTPTLANPFTIRGYSGRGYDRGIARNAGIATAHTRFRDVTEEGAGDWQFLPTASALSTTLRFSRVFFDQYIVEPYLESITGEILFEQCSQKKGGTEVGMFNLRGCTMSVGGLLVIRNCISQDGAIFTVRYNASVIDGGNILIDNNETLANHLIDTSISGLTFTSGGLYIRNNIAKRASGLLVDFGASVIVPTVMNKNRYSHQAGAFQVGGVTYNTIGDWRTAISGDADSTVGDPGIDANGRLLPSSACIGAGLDLHADSLNPFANNYDGMARPS